MIQWVVQSNLNSEGSDLIEKACREIGVQFTPVQIIPFSDTIPDYDHSIPAIFYGSTTMGRLVRGERGFFINDNFTFENYLKKWLPSTMLNDGTVMTIKQAMETSHDWMSNEFFIRPNDDSKSFTGEVLTVPYLKKWFKNLQKSDSDQLTVDTKVLIARPEPIHTEWRLWIIRGKVVAASQYRTFGSHNEQQDCPDKIKRFAESMCNFWTPHDVFCMDICTLMEGLAKQSDRAYILECGCFNSCGFYAADVNEIVKKVSSWYEESVK